MKLSDTRRGMLVLTAAQVHPITLSDGSVVYDVTQRVDAQTTVRFACVDERHAKALAEALSDCAEIVTEPEPKALRALRRLETACARVTGEGSLNVYTEAASNLSVARGIARDVLATPPGFTECDCGWAFGSPELDESGLPYTCFRCGNTGRVRA
jgi:hypothetical protein